MRSFAMHRLPLLIELIFQQPKLSDRKIGQRVGRTAQTVRRYVRLVKSRGYAADELRQMDPRELDRTLNGTRGARPKRKFDARAVRAAATASGTSLRQQWLAYAAIDPETAVGYKHFLKTCQALAPWTPPLSATPAHAAVAHPTRRRRGRARW
jgi:hypothetical protein